MHPDHRPVGGLAERLGPQRGQARLQGLAEAALDGQPLAQALERV
jgi:hypothetical protein